MIKQWLLARKHRRFLDRIHRELNGTDAYIRCLKYIQKKGCQVEIALVVDGVVCPSSLMTNSRDKSGGVVIDFLLQAAIGDRLRLNGIFYGAMSRAAHGELELTENGL